MQFGHFLLLTAAFGNRFHRFGRKLDMHQKTRYLFAHIANHRTEQIERFFFVFVQGVFLTVSAQNNRVTHIFQHLQVFFPQLIQHLQSDVLFQHVNQVVAEILPLARHFFVCRLHDFVGNRFRAQSFLNPRIDGQVQRHCAVQFFLQSRDIPVFRRQVFGRVGRRNRVDDFGAHVFDRVGNGIRHHQLFALFIDDFALVVHHVVVLQQVFADVKVAGFDLFLRFLQSSGNPRAGNHVRFFQSAQRLQEFFDSVRAENTQQIVLQTQEEFGRARVALTSRTAAQLVVDAAAFVAFRADDEQSARFHGDFFARFDFTLDFLDAFFAFGGIGDVRQLLRHAHIKVAAQLNVRAASRHVRRNRNRARHARLGDDVSFLFVVARVQNIETQLGFFFQSFRQLFRFFNRRRADQNGLLTVVTFLNQFDDGGKLLFLFPIDFVLIVNTGDGAVRRDVNDVQVVDFAEFRRFGHCRARHARQLRIQAEVVLERNRRQCLVFGLDFDVFLGFQSLVQAVGIAASFHHAACEFVNDDDLSVADDIIDIALKKLVRFQRLIDIVNDGRVDGVVHRALNQARFLQQFLHVKRARFRQGHRALFFVLFVMFGTQHGN